MSDISKILKEVLKSGNGKLLHPDDIVRKMVGRVPKEDAGEFMVFQAILRQTNIGSIFFRAIHESPEKREAVKEKALQDMISHGIGEPQAEYAMELLDDAIEWQAEKNTVPAHTESAYKSLDQKAEEIHFIKNIVPVSTILTGIKAKAENVQKSLSRKVKNIRVSRNVVLACAVFAVIGAIGVGAWFAWKSWLYTMPTDTTYDTVEKKQNEPSPAPSEPEEAETAKKKAIPKPTSELSLGDISIGYTVEQMHDILGEELDITDPRKNGDKRYMYPDLEVNTRNGIVTALVSKSGRMSTIRGIHQGSTYQEVRKAYGVSELESAYDGMTLYEYRFQSLDQKSCLLRFAIKNGVVDYISARLAAEEPSKGSETKAEGNAAIETLDNYWKAITRKDFNAAYGFATESRKRQMGSMDSFKAGHKDTISSKMVAPKVTEATGNTIDIRFSLEARDHVGSRVKLQTFDCTATMKKVNNTWKIDEITAKKNGERFE